MPEVKATRPSSLDGVARTGSKCTIRVVGTGGLEIRGVGYL